MQAVIFRVVVLVMLLLPTTTFAKTSLALFNLSPASIDAIGLDGDLLFSMRKELERSQTYQLLSRRQMEEGLYRIGGAQAVASRHLRGRRRAGDARPHPAASTAYNAV